MTLSQSEIVDTFKRIHLFRNIDDQRLETAAALVTQLPDYPAGAVIFKQGDYADSDYFYFIASGQVRITCNPCNAHPTGQLGVLEEDDYFGEEILESNWPRQVTAEAVEQTTVLGISQDNFRQILEIIPELGKRLQLILDSYKLMRKTYFTWREGDEAVLFVARRHMIILLQMILPPLAVAAFAVMAFGSLTMTTHLVIFSLLLILFSVSSLGWLIWEIVDWSNDYYVVTSQRVIDQEKVILIYDSRQESPLWALQSTNVHRSQMGRIIGYGNVEIRTFYGTILFRNVALADQVSTLIQEQQMRAQFKRRRMGINDIKQYLDTRLKKGPERPFLPPAKTPPPQPDAVRQFISTMLHLRYESGKTIIYRTNWFILLEKTWVPLLILLALFFLLVASASTQFAFLTVQATCSLLFLFGVVDFCWLAYQYMDWHNDIYLITPDQVVDVNKKPFGREDRLSALIKNIQNIEYKRLGIIGLLFNFGTVYIRVGDRQLTFDDVYRPSDVQRELYHAMSRVRQEENEKQAAERKKELGDWFDSFKQVTHG